MSASWGEAVDQVPQSPPDGFESWEDFAESVGTPAEDRDRLLAVGAKRREGFDEAIGTWTAMHDPEGNGFASTGRCERVVRGTSR